MGDSTRRSRRGRALLVGAAGLAATSFVGGACTTTNTIEPPHDAAVDQHMMQGADLGLSIPGGDMGVPPPDMAIPQGGDMGIAVFADMGPVGLGPIDASVDATNASDGATHD